MVRMCKNQSQLAMVVLDQDKRWRIDLFDINLQLIVRGRQLTINQELDNPNFGCRLTILPDDKDETWLTIERTTHFNMQC